MSNRGWPGLLLDATKNLLSAVPSVREIFERQSERRIREVRDPQRPFVLWRELQDRTKGRLEVRGREVLELGPGKSLGLALVFLGAGARRVYAFDRFKHMFWDALDVAHVRAVLEILRRESWPGARDAERAVGEIAVGQVAFDPDLLVYQQADGARLPLPAASVDISYSNAVLEHVHQPVEVVRELARVTRPAGDSIHEIDFRDHFVSENRLRLLEFSNWEWQARTRMRPGYTNRLRSTDFRRLFAEQGFESTGELVTNHLDGRSVEGMRSRFVAPFRNYPVEELSILSLWGWWQRTGQPKQ